MEDAIHANLILYLIWATIAEINVSLHHAQIMLLLLQMVFAKHAMLVWTQIIQEEIVLN